MNWKLPDGSNPTLTIIGRGADIKPQIMPYTDWSFTTMSAVHDFPNLSNDVPNLVIWDCHDLNAPEGVDVQRRFDIRMERDFVRKALQQFGPHFSNQIGWMLAYAIMMGTKLIHMVGVSMFAEYHEEISNLSYMIGRAEAEGIPVLIEGPSMVTPRQRYGIVPGS